MNEAPIWFTRTRPSMPEVLGSATLAMRRKRGIASGGHATPTRKKSGKLTAISKRTAVSRRRKTEPMN
jgi:hypothetical protein